MTTPTKKTPRRCGWCNEPITHVEAEIRADEKARVKEWAGQWLVLVKDSLKKETNPLIKAFLNGQIATLKDLLSFLANQNETL